MAKFNGAGLHTAVLAACLAAPCWLLHAQAPEARGEEPAPNGFYLHDGDRVVFYGDSITEQGHYASAVETFVRTHFPGLNVSFTNSGWGGDKAWGGEGGSIDERLRRDVIAHRPTVVTVMLGMNDAYYTNLDPKTLQAFADSLEKIIDVLQKELPGVRITLLGTSPYDNVSPGPQPKWEEAIDGGYNSVVRRYSEAAGEVAKRRGLLYVDMNQPLVHLLEEAHKIDHDLAGKLIPDRIHPGPAAGLLMAALLLKAWNAPIIAPDLQIDATAGSVISAAGAKVTDLGVAGGLRWTQNDDSLPFPIDRNDPLAILVLRCSPEVKSLIGQNLRITNLPSDKARLLIDGQQIGDLVSAADWAKGVDLSSLPTPMSRQAAEVEKLNRLRNQAYFTRWRRLQTPFAKEPPADVTTAGDDLDKLDKELADLERTAAEPTPRRFELVSP